MSVEIPLRAKYRRGGSGRNKSRTGNNNPAKPKKPALKGEIEAAQAVTRQYQMVKWLDFETTGNGKIRWMRQSDYEAMRGQK